MSEHGRPDANRWSASVSGLAGRLRIEAEDVDAGRRHAVWLEVRNESDQAVTIDDLPRIDADVVDDDGRRVQAGAAMVSGPEPVRRRLVVPVEAYLGFRVDLRTVGIPLRESGTVLLAVGGAAWQLRPGRYTVRTTVAFTRTDDGCDGPDGPDDRWVGELEPPAVELVVARDQS